MNALNADHPAVKAAVEDQSFGTLRRLHGTRRNNPQQVLGLMRNILRTAIRNLTADDIRDTQAGRDLMAAAWDEGSAMGSVFRRSTADTFPSNPYREGNA